MALVSYKRSLLQLPRKIVIATGSTQGYYYKLGNEMKKIIEKEHPKAHVEILQTQGSFDNLKRIERREADFAFYQNSGDTTTSIRSVANLYSEALHLIVKRPAFERSERSSGITSVKQLKGKVVAIGSEGSGTRLMALEVFKHYGIELKDFDNRSYGLDELDAMFSEDLQAAFVVMGVFAPGLTDLFRQNEDLQLVSIEYSDALNMKYPSMCAYHIPAGAYRTDPPVPKAEFNLGERIPPKAPLPEEFVTVAVKASIITNKHTPSFLVKYFAELIFKNEFRNGMNLIELNSDYAQVEEDFPLHSGAIAYYNRGKPTLYSIFIEGLRRSLVSLIALVVFVIGIPFVLFRKSYEKKKAHRERFADYARKLQEQMGEVLVDEDTHALIRRMQMLQIMQERIVNDNMTGMLENQECMILLQLSAALFNMSHFRILLSEKNEG